MKYIPYLNIVEELDIKKGDTIYLSSQVLRLAVSCRKHGEKFDADKFIDSFIKKIGESGTLFIPTFNWEFSESGIYDYKKSPSTVGSLGNSALKRKDFIRTKHPIHSFAVWGKGKEEMFELKQVDSYDEQSPFRYLLDHSGKEIIVGTDIKHAMTMMHYVEKKVNVPYRFTKYFTGTYIDESGKRERREYSTYARYFCINAQEKQMRLEEMFIKNNATEKKYINGEQFWVNNMQQCFNIMEKELKENQARKMYDFSWPREEVFKYGSYGREMAYIIQEYRKDKKKGEKLLKEQEREIKEDKSKYASNTEKKFNLVLKREKQDIENQVLYLFFIKWLLKEKNENYELYFLDDEKDMKNVYKVININAKAHGKYSEYLYDLSNKNLAESVMEIFDFYRKILIN